VPFTQTAMLSGTCAWPGTLDAWDTVDEAACDVLAAAWDAVVAAGWPELAALCAEVAKARACAAAVAAGPVLAAPPQACMSGAARSVAPSA